MSRQGAGCSRRRRFPGAGRVPVRPLSGCSPSPDSTHFSEPRKHNEPGRSADSDRRFKVAICLQLSLSPQALKRGGSKTGREEGRCPPPTIIFKGAEISGSTKAKPAAKKGNHLYFGSLPPSLRLSVLRLPLEEVKKCGSITGVWAENRGRGAGGGGSKAVGARQRCAEAALEVVHCGPLSSAPEKARREGACTHARARAHTQTHTHTHPPPPADLRQPFPPRTGGRV